MLVVSSNNSVLLNSYSWTPPSWIPSSWTPSSLLRKLTVHVVRASAQPQFIPVGEDWLLVHHLFSTHVFYPKLIQRQECRVYTAKPNGVLLHHVVWLMTEELFPYGVTKPPKEARRKEFRRKEEELRLDTSVPETGTHLHHHIKNWDKSVQE